MYVYVCTILTHRDSLTLFIKSKYSGQQALSVNDGDVLSILLLYLLSAFTMSNLSPFLYLFFLYL